MFFELIPVRDHECVPIFYVDGDLLYGGAEIICVAREKSLHTVETLGFHIKVRGIAMMSAAFEALGVSLLGWIENDPFKMRYLWRMFPFALW